MMVHMDEVDDLKARLARAEEETDAALQAASTFANEAKVQKARADAAEDALARVKALHTSDYTYCVACHDELMPCPTLLAIDGPLL